jgi:hypothetical protein
MASAQTSVTTTGAARAAVQIEPEYRTRIKTYIAERSPGYDARKERRWS